MPKAKESQDFKEKEKLLKMHEELDIKKHQRTMEELLYRRESDRRHHERELERMRIKSAEIKKHMQQKEMMHHG